MSYNRILHIDDDEDDREFFLSAISLISKNITADSLEGGTSALNLLRSGKINPEIIFLDLNMPLMNGREFLSILKSDPDLAGIPVVILSTSAHQPTIDLVRELGALDFITKSYSFNDLVDSLKSFIH